MRKVVLLALLVLSLTACQKKQCWICRYSNASGTTEAIYCEKTRKEIKEIENTPATDVNAQPVNVSCSKK